MVMNVFSLDTHEIQQLIQPMSLTEKKLNDSNSDYGSIPHPHKNQIYWISSVYAL